MFKELFEGITFVARRNLFASLILLTFVDSFFGVAYIQLMPVFAVDILGIGASGMGLLLGASAAGALIGTALAAFWVKGRWTLILLLLGGRGAFWRDGDDLCVQHGSVAIDGGRYSYPAPLTHYLKLRI